MLENLFCSFLRLSLYYLLWCIALVFTCLYDSEVLKGYSLQKNEAVIYVAENATLDFETKAVYNLVVQASDNVGGQNTVKFVADAAVRYFCF